MKTRILILLCFLITTGYSQTIIKDGQEISGEWTIEGSPYIIEGKAVIPIGKVLRVLPAVEIKFKADPSRSDDNSKSAYMLVLGTLQAQGTKENLISFDVYGEGMWGAVYFDSTSANNKLKYCKITNSYGLGSLNKNVQTVAAIVLYASELEMENCIVLKNWRGIETAKSKLRILNSSLVQNEEAGIMILDTNDIEIVNSILWGSYYTIYISRKADEKLNRSKLTIKHTVLENNVYHLTGVNIYSAEPSFADNENFEVEQNSFYSNKADDQGKIGFR